MSTCSRGVRTRSCCRRPTTPPSCASTGWPGTPSTPRSAPWTWSSTWCRRPSVEAEVLNYLGPTDLVQYFIRNTSMVNTLVRGQEGVRVYVVMGRRILSSVLTVYLPTCLLILMAHVTVYFKPFFFEAIITVNLTVMLVLTTM